MRCWTTGAATSRGERFVDGAVAMIDAIGTEAFGPRAADALAAVVPLAYVTAYRKRGGAPVTMPVAGSRATRDVTARCWRIYRDGPHRRDPSLDEAAGLARGGRTAWCHLTADQIVDRRHRVDVYERHALIDRLSLVDAIDDDGWLSVNLFRVDGQGHFADRELATIEDAAPLLMALVRRHVGLSERRTFDRETLRRALRLRAPDLTERELDVCERLARGMTYDGIAVDLGIAVTSAKTYRNRAFARLDLRFRSELAPLCWNVG